MIERGLFCSENQWRRRESKAPESIEQAQSSRDSDGSAQHAGQSCDRKCADCDRPDDSRTIPDALDRARLLALAEGVEAVLRAGLVDHARGIIGEMINMLRAAPEPALPEVEDDRVVVSLDRARKQA